LCAVAQWPFDPRHSGRNGRIAGQQFRSGNVLRSKISAEELPSAIAQTITDSGSLSERASAWLMVADEK